VFGEYRLACSSEDEGYTDIYGMERVDVDGLKDQLKWIDTRWCKKYIRCAPGTRSKKNKGEKGEERMIQYLFDHRADIGVMKHLFGIESTIELRNPDNGQVLSVGDIKNWKSKAKADIMVHFIEANITKNPSIKCFDGSAPTLLNHTRRSAKCFQEGSLHSRLPILDHVICKMNHMRNSGSVGEDIPYTDLTLSDEETRSLVEVIRYFTFSGTGRCISSCAADSVLVVPDSLNIHSLTKFVDCDTHEKQLEYVRAILNDLRFSIRSGKGMLPETSANYHGDMMICEPWIFRGVDSKPHGALHIRFI